MAIKFKLSFTKLWAHIFLYSYPYVYFRPQNVLVTSEWAWVRLGAPPRRKRGPRTGREIRKSRGKFQLWAKGWYGVRLCWEGHLLGNRLLMLAIKSIFATLPMPQCSCQSFTVHSTADFQILGKNYLSMQITHQHP